MTQPNQIKKSDDFKLVIVFRIEGQNSRAIMLRFVGIAVTLIVIAVKIALIFMERAHCGPLCWRLIPTTWNDLNS